MELLTFEGNKGAIFELHKVNVLELFVVFDPHHYHQNTPNSHILLFVYCIKMFPAEKNDEII